MSAIEIIEHVIRIQVVRIMERLDAFNAPQIRAEFSMLLENGENRFVLDLSDTPFLDSAGMAVLVSLLKGARTQGGDVKMVWPQHEGAKRILSLTKFDRVFEMASSVEEGLGMF
jgi:anti-anti-sigma factor